MESVQQPFPTGGGSMLFVIGDVRKSGPKQSRTIPKQEMR